MAGKPNLTRIFLEHAPVRVGVPEDAIEFEDQLWCSWEVGRDPWPQVALPADVFVRHLAQRISKESAGLPLAQVLARYTLTDLYLACACVQDVPTVPIKVLESHYIAKLPVLLGGLKLPDMMVDDVCQAVRIHLLLGTNGSRPRLAEYAGIGSLLSWIRVIAVRMAIKQGALTRVMVPEENVLADLEAMTVPGGGMDLEFIKRRYSGEFRQAMYEAFAELSDAQRQQIWLHYIKRVSTSALGRKIGKSQSTASRWLKDAREVVQEGTKRRLRKKLGLRANEFESLWNIIESQIDLSISQVFVETE
ncbi:sigma-70 family RNA polymerase sigma factor [Archangium violaceum]|uniref:sigma-70 family RNA polymerase sigma factor n=1 Tax=Archangium violaceum TaxID=83451 RepID=UPI002B2BA33B|nr:sigma-70 family RNA polymerase sigma factor [Archangium gephyra]